MEFDTHTHTHARTHAVVVVVVHELLHRDFQEEQFQRRDRWFGDQSGTRAQETREGMAGVGGCPGGWPFQSRLSVRTAAQRIAWIAKERRGREQRPGEGKRRTHGGSSQQREGGARVKHGKREEEEEGSACAVLCVCNSSSSLPSFLPRARPTRKTPEFVALFSLFLFPLLLLSFSLGEERRKGHGRHERRLERPPFLS